MEYCVKNFEKWYGIKMFSSTGTPITGRNCANTTVKLFNIDTGIKTAIIINSGNFEELSEGVYRIKLNISEIGNYYLKISSGSTSDVFKIKCVEIMQEDIIKIVLNNVDNCYQLLLGVQQEVSNIDGLCRLNFTNLNL